MTNYGYLFMGLVLGIALSIYFYINREEKIEKEIELNKKIFSTKLLDSALDKAVFKMKQSISEKSRELSEDEKNEIIFDCLNRQKNIMDEKSNMNENI